MRYHFWQFLIDEEGRPIKNAAITVYEAGTEKPLYVYLNEYGPDGTNGGSDHIHVYTDNSGLFEFWVGDHIEEEGYSSSTKIKIKWSKKGMFEGVIDHINIFPINESVNLNSTDAYRNKLVSNLLAKSWTDHLSEDNHIVHGLNELNLESITPIRNKLVSNLLGYGWEYHKNTRYDGSILEINPGEEGVPHGIQPINIEEPTDYKINKLVSNDLIRGLSTIDSNLLPLDLGQFAFAGSSSLPSRQDHKHSYNNLMTISHPANNINGFSDNAMQDITSIAINGLASHGTSNLVARSDHVHSLVGLTHNNLHGINGHINYQHITTTEKNKYDGYGSSIQFLNDNFQFIYDNLEHVLQQINTVDVSDDYLANINEVLLIDTRDQQIKIVLPANPSRKTRIQIIDVYDNFSINNVELDGNGNMIKGHTSFILDVEGSSTLFYVNETVQWIFI